MRIILASLLLLACLAYGIPAHAWAIYNDSSNWICFDEDNTYWNVCCGSDGGNKVPPNGAHNGCHDCKAAFHIIMQDANGNCWASPKGHIPNGGFIRAYNDRIEVWQHCDTCPPSDRLHTYSYEKVKCHHPNPYDESKNK